MPGRCSRVAGQLERLTPASSEITSLSFAVTAWIFHPAISTKAIEGERVAPYPIKTMSTDRIELHPWNNGGGMARKGRPRRVDEDHLTTPSGDTGFRITRVIIRQDRLQLDASAQLDCASAMSCTDLSTCKTASALACRGFSRPNRSTAHGRSQLSVAQATPQERASHQGGRGSPDAQRC
jgi:hypothetical protein